MIRILRAVLLSMTLLAAGQGLAAGDVTYYSDIRPLMENKCLGCHSEKSVSFSFEDPEVTYEFRAAISAAVAERRMPPWLAAPGHQVYTGDYSLSADELKLFELWAQASHAKGTPLAASSAPVAAADFVSQLTLDVQPDFAYLPNQTRKDDYRCFLVDWPYQETKYVTGFKAEPGNLRIAHHLVLFAVRPESAEFIRTLNREEEGHGHQCFGGVQPDKLAGDKAAREALEQRFPGAWKQLANDYYWLSHWAPGVTGFEFPEDTGVLVVPGSVLVVQMHYYSAYAPGETDGNTRMRFQLSDAVKKPSINYPMTHRDWLYSKDNESLVVPVGESRTYETSNGFDAIARRAEEILNVDSDAVAAIELRSANLHMHAFGASGVVSLHHASGMKETLLEIPRWDLNWQRDFEFVDAKTITPEQFEDTRLGVECTFDNYSEDTVFGGYGSYDEMCFNFSYVSLVTKARAGDGEARVASP